MVLILLNDKNFLQLFDGNFGLLLSFKMEK